MTTRIRATAAAIAAALVALLVPLVLATPAAATETDAVCDALTTEGLDLLADQKSIRALLAASVGIDAADKVTPGQITDARSKLKCGPAPTGRSAAEVRADVCAALKVDTLLGIPARLDASAKIRGLVAALGDTAVPAAVKAARDDLDCGEGGKVTSTTKRSDDSDDDSDDDDSDHKSSDSDDDSDSDKGSDTDTSVLLPVGAPETGGE